MQNNKIKIRHAAIGDSQSIFDWRIDENSRAMFFNEASPSIEEHNLWFEKSLSNFDRTLFIGELGDEKIGVCRFDFKKEEMVAEVSINMKPTSREHGLGKRFLFGCVECYLEINKYNLVAKVKPNNLASLNIFESVGFETYSSNKDEVILRNDFKDISFKDVSEEDAEVLLELLERRDHTISHHERPTDKEHLQFLKSKPYRYWVIVLEDNCPVGTFYIQKDNSVGLNLLHPKKQLLHRILCQIQRNFKPLAAIKSKVPSYFYINVAYSNETLKKLLCELDAVPIQTSYKINLRVN
ncbi:GNAT family N-acetyltransferase [Vibrio ostreicida]|uniref:GNAT family N-acetyltransferase n=1 Tax=Vibrio ostreicida TaxID=526588 RepID=UPI00097055E1|nr:GNAT family N-acetyltransferase [Vibrio ostreicida]